MSSQTPNINLTLPTGAEKVSRQIINDNNTKIDTAVGTLNDNLTPSNYDAPTMGTGVTLIFGGYKKVGKIVIVNIRMNVSSSVTNLCSGLPVPLSISSLTQAQAVCAFASNVSSTNSIYINKNGEVIAENAESNRNIVISGVYICE